MKDGIGGSVTGFPCTVFGASHSMSLEGSEHWTEMRIGPKGDWASDSQNDTLDENAACLFKPNSRVFPLMPANRLLRAASRILSLRKISRSLIRWETESVSARTKVSVPIVRVWGASWGRMFLNACMIFSGFSVGRISVSAMSLNINFSQVKSMCSA